MDDKDVTKYYLDKTRKLSRAFMSVCDAGDASYRLGVLAGLEFVCFTGAHAGMTADELCAHLHRVFAYMGRDINSTTGDDDLLDSLVQSKKSDSE